MTNAIIKLRKKGQKQMKETIIRNNFKYVREHLNITQTDMAAFLGLEQSMISKFESGERALTVYNIEKACALFGISYSDLTKEQQNISLVSPSFRKSNLSVESLEHIAAINRIALNLLEMEKLLNEEN